MTIGLIRAKNAARWIGRTIASIWPLCDRILVLDDASADDTGIVCLSSGCRVIRSSGLMNEPEGKDYLLAQLWHDGATLGDNVLLVDADETLVPEDIPNLAAAIDHGVDAAAFQIIYLWSDEQTVRVDGTYGNFYRPSMFRLTSRDLGFLRTGGAGFHCSNVPAQLINKAAPIPVRLLHYGYLDRAERERKYCWYNAKEWAAVAGRAEDSGELMDRGPAYWAERFHGPGVPPGLLIEDGYRHMLIGDHFPADSRFLHAGPLKLTPLAELRNNRRWFPRIDGHYDARNSVFEPPEMAAVLQYHKVLVDGREVRWVWFLDTDAGVVKTYDPEAGGEHEDMRQFPLIVSSDSWTLRGKVEVVRK